MRGNNKYFNFRKCIFELITFRTASVAMCAQYCQRLNFSMIIIREFELSCQPLFCAQVITPNTHNRIWMFVCLVLRIAKPDGHIYSRMMFAGLHSSRPQNTQPHMTRPRRMVFHTNDAWSVLHFGESFITRISSGRHMDVLLRPHQ